MRIRQIELENFLSHEHESVALPEEGVFFLDAPSGWGKSSFIVDAVLYALFGPKAARGRQEDLPHLDYPGEPMRVQVTFEFEGGEILSVERNLTLKGSKLVPAARVIDRDGKLLAEGPKATDRYIKKRLGGMSWQQLRAAFVCHQEEVAALTELAPAERKKLVHRLLGVRELELAQESLYDRRREAKAALDQVQARVGERTKESEEARLAECQRVVYDLSTERSKVEQDLAAGERGLGDAQESLAPLKAAASAKEQIMGLEASIRHRAQSLSEQKDKLSTQETIKRRLEEEGPQLALDLQAAEQELDRLAKLGERSGQHQKLALDRKAAEDRLAVANAALAALNGAQATPEGIEARLVSLTAERQRLSEELVGKSHDFHVLDEQGVCFTCQRPLGEGEERTSVLAAVEEARDEIEKRQRQLESEEAELQTSLPQAREQAVARKDAEKDVTTAEANVAQLATQMTALEEEGVGGVEELRAAWRECKEATSALEAKRGEHQALKGALEPELEKKVAELEREQAEDKTALVEARKLAKVEVDAGEIVRLEALVNELTQKIGECRGRLQGLAGQEKLAAQALEGAERDLVRFRDLLDRRELLHGDVLRLETLSSYLEQFIISLAAEIRPEIEEIAGQMIYQMSGGRFVAMEVDQDYNILIQREEGNWIKPSSISGGEKVRANLCLRLALMRLVSQRTGVPVQFIMLDEPFGNLDAALIDASMGLLGSLRGFYPQIFLISHTGDLASNQHVDYRLAFESAGGRDRIRLYQR
jgi:exonuclease SbcC